MVLGQISGLFSPVMRVNMLINYITLLVEYFCLIMKRKI